MLDLRQEYTSADTSINTVSAVYKKLDYFWNVVILDYGGGKYDTNIKYMNEKYNSIVLVYDPFNRTPEHNQKVLSYFAQNPAKHVVCSNVLNVIKEDEVILEILRHIYSLMDKNGWLYIKIYERDKSGIGCKTTKGWQRNQKLSEYIPFVEKAFNNNCKIKVYKGLLFVQKL